MPTDRKRITFQDDSDGPEWVAVYHLGYDDADDDFDNTETQEIMFHASDFDVAVRYAQQYLRKMQTEEETQQAWANAQILSVEMY